MAENPGASLRAGPIAPDVVERKVLESVARALDMDPEEVQLSSTLMGELGAESLDLLDIAFMIEKEYKIAFPRTEIIERAAEHFGEEALVVDGMVTPLGLEMLRRGMPEIDPSILRPGFRVADAARLPTVETLVRVTLRLLEFKAQFPRVCPDCGGPLREAEIVPEFVCDACGAVQPLPSGDDILLQDTIALGEGLPASFHETGA